MKKYVVGFAFTEHIDKVVLINKIKPEWQKDKLNGVGGKVEEGESFIDAMVREFWEETGVQTKADDWKHFATMTFDHGALHSERAPAESVIQVYSTFNDEIVANIKTTTTEVVDQYRYPDVLESKIIPNLHWIMPAAVYSRHESVHLTASWNLQ